MKRSLPVNRAHQLRRIRNIFAHESVTIIAPSRRAALLKDRIAIRARAHLHVVLKDQRPAHVGAGGSVIAKHCVDGAIFVLTQRKTLLRPSLQSLSIYAVIRILVQRRRANDLLTPGSRSATVWRAAELARTERAVFAGDQTGEPAESLGVTRQAEDSEQSLLRAQHACLKNFHGRRKRLPLPALHQFEQPGLLGYIPLRVPRTVVRQHRHLPLLRPFAEPSAGGRSQMFDHRRAKHLQKEIFVRLPLLPAPVRLGLSFRPCAYRNKDYGVCSRLL